MLSKLSKLYTLQLLSTIAEVSAWSFFPLYAFKEGLDYSQIAISYLLIYVVGLIVILVSPRYGKFGNMSTGLVLKGISVLVLTIPINEYIFYLSGAIYGLTLRTFWIPYNAYFMQVVKGEKRAESSGKLFALLAVTAATLPILWGGILHLIGYNALFLFATSWFLLAAIYSISEVRSRPFTAHLDRRAIKRLDFLFFEGLWQGCFWVSIPLGTIFFLKGERDFGMFMAFLGAMGGLASIFVGRWSDKHIERRKPLVISAFAAFLFSIIGAFFTRNLIYWSLSIGLAYFSIYIMYNFTFTYTKEVIRDSFTAMAVREMLLNLGRFVGVIILLVSFQFTTSLVPSLLIGAISLLIIVIVAYKRAEPFPRS